MARRARPATGPRPGPTRSISGSAEPVFDRERRLSDTMGGMLFEGYGALPGTFDEMFDGGAPRHAFARVAQLLDQLGKDELARAQALAEHALLQQGVTFSVYGDSRGTEKIFPFCVVPRVVTAGDFQKLERGL